MKSHTCEFHWRDLLLCTGGPLIPVALFALLMHAGAWLHLLPAPRAALDTDRTILIHQAEASRVATSAHVLLLGDSSCLMDVSARQLSERLGQPVLNLGNLSYLDAAAQSLLLREYTAANPGRLQAVVLLMHPEALRRQGAEAYQLSVLTNFLGATDHVRTENIPGNISWLLGVEIFRGRLLARLLPIPLGGAYGRFYGFTSDLEAFMSANHGSAVDPEVVPLIGSAEFRLSPSLEKAAARFKAAMPAGAKLFVGLTPVPEGFAGSSFAAQQAPLLRQWSEWLDADAALTDLPASLPDDQFTRTTHLTPAAVPAYTEALAVSLRQRLK